MHASRQGHPISQYRFIVLDLIINFQIDKLLFTSVNLLSKMVYTNLIRYHISRFTDSVYYE